MLRVVLECGHWFFSDLTDWECERMEALCPLCGLSKPIVEVCEVEAVMKVVHSDG